MNKINQLAKIHHSGKPYIIYKSQNGFDLYTDFSKKIILNNNNVKSFLNSKRKNKSKNTDLFIGFFGYELLNYLINIKLPKQKNINFPKGIFYKPETKINLSDSFEYKFKNRFKSNNFKINIDINSYTKIFNKFKKKLNEEKHIKLKFAQNTKQSQK